MCFFICANVCVCLYACTVYARAHVCVCLCTEFIYCSFRVSGLICSSIQVIQEFKVIKDSLPSEPSVVSWKQPDFPALHHFMCSQLTWERDYVNKKMSVLMTQWAIRQHLRAQQAGTKCSTDIKPLRILKHRISSGVHLSEVEWMGVL